MFVIFAFSSWVKKDGSDSAQNRRTKNKQKQQKSQNTNVEKLFTAVPHDA